LAFNPDRHIPVSLVSVSPRAQKSARHLGRANLGQKSVNLLQISVSFAVFSRTAIGGSPLFFFYARAVRLPMRTNRYIWPAGLADCRDSASQNWRA
jgi:hypothetical protein